MSFYRRDKSIFSKWWLTIDRVMLLAIAILIAIGLVMVTTASPTTAQKLGLESFYFIKRQFLFFTIAISLMLFISFFPLSLLKRSGLLGTLLTIGLLVAVLFLGSSAKGATRWIYIGSFSLQPSEFLKPFFVLVTAWLLSEKCVKREFPGYSLSFALYGICTLLLILQPDFGMSVVISIIWGGQLFLAGLPLLWILLITFLGLTGVIGAYLTLSHVADRINSFLYPKDNDNYQVQKSLDAFSSGGFTGKGPGEGTVKQLLPDSHTDFIFAVVGEEMGMIMCLLIIILFSIIVIRSLLRMLPEQDLFTIYATAGLCIQLGIQAIINMGVALHLLPTKGMTLPFISYGGSSTLATGISLGLLLALTRRRYGNTVTKWITA